MRLFYTLLLLVLSTGFCFAQKQGNQWYFGFNAGLDFNSGTPVPITTGALATAEGCASIADKTTGNVLFYTDGTYCYDRTNNQMPNGYGLGGDPSTTQSAVIVPMPGSTTKYYVFTADAEAGYFNTGDSGVNYNIVDMTLNGGLGDVSVLDQPLVSPACEKIAATYASNDTDIWVVVHQWNTNNFYAYEVTASGISVPVISSTGIIHQDVGSGLNGEAIGYMEVSPNGQMLALACYIDLNTVQLFNFDNTTGVVSAPIMTDTNYPNILGFDGPYGLSFSPDNSKMYVGYLGYVSTATQVYQYNLLAGNGAAILASRTSVAIDSINVFGALQIGPDGKMYVAKDGADSLDVIENPNGLGAACNFTYDGVFLSTGTCTLGLPDMIEQYLSPCSPASLSIVPQAPFICAGTTITLDVSGGTTYTWSPSMGISATTGDSVVAGPSVTTTYTVTSGPNGCASSDTDVVSIIPLPNKPTISQKGFVLTSSATQGNQWVLNDTIIPGATNQTYTFTKLGWYQVIAENPANGCSSTSDSTDITSGINQLTIESGQVTVYPNPTSGEINVNISSSAMDVKAWNLQVTDVLGRTVFFKQSLNYNNEIDLFNLSAGVYFICVVNNTDRVVVPIVKQ